ncbi:helix-turn-helix domain-containing protein, partial [Sporosarcina gallistercoris]|uniref:helix-turn-helix domain-containing protein n=1 Tax=Sporosarcina gallistercoris TaxID=2762245 RepID=UPI003D276898
MNIMLIGDKIKEARNKKRMTQQDLADLLNISRSAISNWEVGRNYPDLDMIVQLSDILEISLN